MTTTRRVLWWIMTVLLTVALAAAGVFATLQGLKAFGALTEPDPLSTSDWQDVADTAGDHIVALLSYTPDTVESKVTEVDDLATGEFADYYREFVRSTVIPKAKEEQISAEATVPAIGVQSATDDTVTLVAFVNQSSTTGTAAPETTTSAVQVTLQNVDGRWLMSRFDPI